jgi:CubicO group peptidase (beta-lactamase class C family)
MCILLYSGYINAQVRNVSGSAITDQQMDTFLRQQMDSLGMPGLSIAVINKGKVVYRRVLGVANTATKEPVTFSSIFEAGSLSKPLFTYFVLKMAERRLLNLDTPLYRYLPLQDIAYDERYKLITARMVLCHTTGFPNWRDIDLPDTSLHIKPGILYLKFRPGTRFSYSGEGYKYLSKVLAHQAHTDLKGLDSVFQEVVARPLGMKHTSFCWNSYLVTHKVRGHIKGLPHGRWPSGDSTAFGAAGSLHTGAENYSKFLIALMKEKGLCGESFKEMFTEQVKVPVSNKFAADGTTGWALGLSLRQTPAGIRYKHEGNNGNFQSGFVFYRAQQNGYVFFTNCEMGREFNRRLEKFLAE